MFNVTVINDSTLDNNPKNFQVKDWSDLCDKLFEKLRDEDNNPLSEIEKFAIRNDVRFQLQDGLTVNLSKIIDLSTGNFYSSAATPIKPSINLQSASLPSVAAGVVKNFLPAINTIVGKKPKNRYYQWN